MLKVENLFVRVLDKDILKGFNIDIKDGEIHAIMGPNGTGKSTLSRVIMGDVNYEVISGNIIYEDEIINNLKTHERAQRGIFLSMQNPPSIEGVTNSEFIKTAINSKGDVPIGLYEYIKTLEKQMDNLKIDKSLIHKSINLGSSGGERKKNEILQLRMLKPKFIILDELDSGLDVDNLKLVCQNINDYLIENPSVSVLIITHYPRILEYLRPDYVHMMDDGVIVKTGGYEFAYEIEKEGYSKINNISGNLDHE